MKTFRIAGGWHLSHHSPRHDRRLSLPPANYAYAPGTLGELLYPIFGVPILIFNVWAWVHPEIIECYFFGKQKDDL